MNNNWIIKKPIKVLLKVHVKFTPFAVLFLLNSYYRTCPRCDFADPQREGYKLHSLVSKLNPETNVNFPAPFSYHISGIFKNIADTWKAATRVLSRERKREDPGNEGVETSALAQIFVVIRSIFRSCESQWTALQSCLEEEFCQKKTPKPAVPMAMSNWRDFLGENLRRNVKTATKSINDGWVLIISDYRMNRSLNERWM